MRILVLFAVSTLGRLCRHGLVLCTLVSTQGWAADLPLDALLAAYVKPQSMTSSGDIAESSSAVDSDSVMHLRAAIARYRAWAESGGWPRVSTGAVLNPGARHRRVSELRARLAFTGDYHDDAMPGSDLYDSGLAKGVRRFQLRHGLEADGIVGTGTVNAMNVTAQTKLQKLQINLSRHQRIQQHSGRHVLVNIPEFRMRVLDDRKEILSMNVVVGKRKFATPEISDSIDYIVFNPYWNVPTSIAVREVLPKLQDNPNYLAEQRMELLSGAEVVDPASVVWDQFNGKFPFRLRQRPGQDNALGAMKFIFPNAHSIYLHDTPVRWPFSTPNRALSHGCVRLERPADLAHALLNGQQNWDQDRFSSIQAAGRERVVTLQQPVPVDLVYLTAKADALSVWFYPDLYGRDVLAAPSPIEKSPVEQSPTGKDPIATELAQNTHAAPTDPI